MEEKNLTPYERFSRMYRNPSALDKIKDMDDAYGYCDQMFSDNAVIMEEATPELAEGDSDSEKWYDEYRDYVVAEYCGKVEKYLNLSEPETVPFSNPIENIVGEIKDNSSVWDFLNDYGGSAYARLDMIGMSIEDEGTEVDDEFKGKSMDELKAMYDEQLSLTLSVAFKAYANELNCGNVKIKTDFGDL